MSRDDMGLTFFTDDDPEKGKAKPSVFGAVNQDDMIARIDSTSEDDLSSAFFGDSIQDVEDAAVRMFDIGVRTMTEESDQSSGAAFGSSATPASRVPSFRAAPERPVVRGAGALAGDPAARAAFILGGPLALAS
jgi:hypothetical protein